MRHPDRTLLSQWHLSGNLKLTRGCRLKTHVDLFPVFLYKDTHAPTSLSSKVAMWNICSPLSCGKTSPVQARQLDEQPWTTINNHEQPCRPQGYRLGTAKHVNMTTYVKSSRASLPKNVKVKHKKSSAWSHWKLIPQNIEWAERGKWSYFDVLILDPSGMVWF